MTLILFPERIENFQENIWPTCLPESPIEDINHLDCSSGFYFSVGDDTILFMFVEFHGNNIYMIEQK